MSKQLHLTLEIACTRLLKYIKEGGYLKFDIPCASKAGQTLVELLIAIGLSAIILPALAVGFMATRDGRVQEKQRIEAVSIYQETLETVRSVRERGWTTFAVNGTYHPVISGSAWTFAEGPETIGDFTRQIVVEDVERDANGAIVTSGGTMDPSTKKVTITVTWTIPNPGSIGGSIYVTRYLDNLTFVHTTQADFNTDTISNTQVINTSGGEIRLSNNTKGKWCEPQISSATINLSGTPVAVWAAEGHVQVAIDRATSPSQDAFAHVLVSNTDPPVGTVNGVFRGYDTRAVFGELDWGYLATTNNTKEIVIVDLHQFSSPGVYQEVGSFNTTTNSGSSDGINADTIFVHGSRGYMTAGSYLYVFDLSSHSGSRPKIGNRIQIANSGDRANEIYVREVNNNIYVFVAVEGSTVEELKIVNATNHTNSNTWRVVGQLNIEPNNCSTLESGKAIYVKPDGTRAYISSVNDASFKEFFTIDTSNKSSPSLVGGFATQPTCTNGGGYEAGGMDPEQSVVVSILENRAILVGVDAVGGGNSEEYQVLDLTNEANPTKCGGLQLDQGIYGIAAVKEEDGDAYTYIITGDSANELKIIQGGPDGTYVESGTAESPIFDAGYSTAFNRYTSTMSTPAGTSIKFQFAVTDPVNGSCANATYSFTGPDGTSNSFYTQTEDEILLDDNGSGYENPGRCFKYKVFFETTDYSATPILNDLIVNYSP